MNQASRPAHRFIKVVLSRWSTIEPLANRLLEQWPALVENVHKFVRTKQGLQYLKNTKYKSN